MAGIRPLPLPAGLALVPLDDRLLAPIHGLLEAAYRDSPDPVEPFGLYWPALRADAEFDPDLCLIAATEAGAVVGYTQCWTSGFIKDLVVANVLRGQGVGAALLGEAFARFADRGLVQVDLKVQADNHAARRLYARAGMVEVPL